MSDKLTDWQQDVVEYFASDGVAFTDGERDELFAAVDYTTDMIEIRAKAAEIVGRR